MLDVSNLSVIVSLMVGIVALAKTVIGQLKKFKKEIIEEVTAVQKENMDEIYNNQRMQLRYEISNFAGDLRNGIKKTREEFKAIFEMYETYEKLVRRLNQKNHYIENDYAYIQKQYQKQYQIL